MPSQASRGVTHLAASTTFVMVAALIALRNPTPLLRAEFWAEDASVFFADALNAGWHSLYTPVYGYHFLVSRLIAWVASMCPVVAAPYVYSWGAFAANTVAIGYFSRSTFRWLIPSDFVRAALCLLMVLAPGGGEVMMNLCNLMTPLTLLALLLLIESPGRLSWRRFAVLLFLAASAGPILMMSPLIAYLGWHTRDRRYFALIGAMLPIFLANVAGNHVTGVENGLLNYWTAALIPQALVDNFSLRLFVLPIVGTGGASALMAANSAVYWSASLAGATLLFWLWRRGRPSGAARLWHDEAATLLLVGYSCAVLTFAGIIVSRSYAVLQVVRQSGDPLWHVRYAYLPGVVALMIWTVALHRIAPRGAFNAGLAYTLISVIAAHEGVQWKNYPERRDIRWPVAATAIQQAVDARTRGTLSHAVAFSVPVHPVYWRNGAITVQVSPATRPK